MVAKPVTVPQRDDAAMQIETGLLDVQRFMDDGDWEKVEATVRRLRSLVVRVPMAERRDVLLAVRDAVERIRPQAVGKRDELGRRLAAIKTGRRAAESYRATSAMSMDTSSSRHPS